MKTYINPYKTFVSIHIPNWLARRQRTEISQSAKLMYGRLAQYAGKEGKAFPHIDTLADEIGLKSRQAAEALRELILAGLVEMKVRDGKPNLYKFLSHEWVNCGRAQKNQLRQSAGIIAQTRNQNCTNAIINKDEENHGRESLKTSGGEAGEESPPDFSGEAIILASRYVELRNVHSSGRRWTEKTVEKNMMYFLKAVELCKEFEVSPGAWLKYCVEEYPRFTHKFPIPTDLISRKMMERFVSPEMKSSSEVHFSVKLEENHENYPEELAARFVAAGFKLPEEKSNIGRLVNDAKLKASELPNTQGLPWGHHVHACLVAAYENPSGLKAWIQRDIEQIKTQWENVIETVTKLLEEDYGRLQCWEPLIKIYQETRT